MEKFTVVYSKHAVRIHNAYEPISFWKMAAILADYNFQGNFLNGNDISLIRLVVTEQTTEAFDWNLIGFI